MPREANHIGYCRRTQHKLTPAPRPDNSADRDPITTLKMPLVTRMSVGLAGVLLTAAIVVPAFTSIAVIPVALRLRWLEADK